MIVSRMEPSIYIPGDLVLAKDSRVCALYIISKGHVRRCVCRPRHLCGLLVLVVMSIIAQPLNTMFW